MALTRKQQKKLGAMGKLANRKKIFTIADKQLKSDLLAGNLRLAEIIRDKSVKPRFKKMASAEIKINIHEIAKLQRKEKGEHLPASFEKEMEERFEKAIRSGELSK